MNFVDLVIGLTVVFLVIERTLLHVKIDRLERIKLSKVESAIRILNIIDGIDSVHYQKNSVVIRGSMNFVLTKNGQITFMKDGEFVHKCDLSKSETITDMIKRIHHSYITAQQKIYKGAL